MSKQWGQIGMRWQRKKNIWPYLSALSCLFLLSLFVPKAWQRQRNQETQPQATSHRPIPQRQMLQSGNSHSAQTEQPSCQVVRLKAERVLDLPASSSPHAMVPPELPTAAETNITQTSIVISNEDYLLIDDAEENASYQVEPQLPALISPAVREELVLELLPPHKNFQLDTLLSFRNSLTALVKQAATEWTHWDLPQQVLPLKQTDHKLVDKSEPTELPNDRDNEESSPPIGPTLSSLDIPTSLTIISKKIVPGDTHRKTEGTSEPASPSSNIQVSILLHSLPKVSSENDRLAMRITRNPSHIQIPRSEALPLTIPTPNDTTLITPMPGVTQPDKPPRLAQAPITPTPIIRAPAIHATLSPKSDVTRPDDSTLNAETPNRTTHAKPSPSSPPVTPWLVNRPIVLLKSLNRLKDISEISYQHTKRMDAVHWANEVSDRINLLTNQEQRVKNASVVVSQLQRLVTLGENGAIQDEQTSIHLDWLQAVRALQRRLGVWQLLVNTQSTPPNKDQTLPSYPTAKHYLALQQTSWQFSQLTADSTEGVAWREYLLHDSILEMAQRGLDHKIDNDSKTERHWQRLLTQQILARMDDSRLTVAQQKFLLLEPVISLRHQLQYWAKGPVDLQQLAALIEEYERHGRDHGGQRVAEYLQRLKWSNDPSQRMLAEQLDRHYRKANVRIAISEKFLNHLLPEQKPTVTHVHDNVVGIEVRGHARTNTNVKLRLLPDTKVWRFSLEAHGNVSSRTHSDTWPARIHNVGAMQYEASKQIALGDEGLQIAPATARTNGRNRLVEVETPLDPIPVVNSLLHDWIRQQHKKTQPRALAQVKSKTTSAVKQRMNQKIDTKLHQLEHQFHETVLARLEQLALVAEPMELYTTDERVVARLRLAGENQLAAHSLRPLAPSDSWMSVQLHNSAFNNSMAGFELDGRRLSLGQLFDLVTEKLQLTDIQRPHDLPDRAIVEFAPHDAICVDCRNDRLELVLNIRELSYGRDKIRNFQVHAHFRPKLNGLQVTLVRDGTLQFSGRRLLTGPRMVLHSIFGKLLRRDQQLLLLGEKIQQDPRTNGLMITQLIIDQGWIGVAWGKKTPERVAWRSR
ncbi:MAG: hypothetical protein ABGX16_12320 [Pirellulales bacterium]